MADDVLVVHRASEIDIAPVTAVVHAGRRSRSSGRAVVTTSSGCSCTAPHRHLDEAQHRLVGPVHVLEDDHRGLLGGDGQQEPPPRRLGVRGCQPGALQVHLGGRQADQRAQRLGQPAASGPSNKAPHRLTQAPVRGRLVVGVQHAPPWP